MSELLFKDEVYAIIGMCMEVHNELGHGFSEIVYKDALQSEFDEHGITYEREKEFAIYYKDRQLKHKFFADMLVSEEIILEIKCVKMLTGEHTSQAINYLKASGKKLALLVNFARGKLEYKRIVY